MPENAEHKSTADVLQSSELAARLLRRLIASPGVIDTQRLFRTYARLTELITHAHPLLQDLLARHSIDDDSAGQNLPLVMDQPWLVNLNTYLTNNSSISSTSTTNNSYFATTNQFVSQANTTALTHTELHETTSQSPPSEKFRISRTPPALRQNVPVDTKEAVLNPVPKLTERSISPLVHSKGQPLTLAKGEDRKGEPVKHALSQVPASTEPLARTTVSPPVIQRESLETEIRTTRLVLKDTEKIKIEKHSAKSDSIDTRLETKTLQPPAAKKDTATETAAPPALPLAQEHISSSQMRPPQLVWRKNTENQTLRDLVTDLSTRSSSAAVRQALDSLPAPQLPPSAQFINPESSRREVEPPAAEEITTEGMLRRISKMLLIERERRGY